MIDIFFMVSLFDLIDNQHFINLCNKIGVHLDHVWLEEKYDNIPRGQGDALLFQSKEENGVLFLNLFQSPTDQNEIIEIGVRCKEVVLEEILKSVRTIYNTATVKSSEIKVSFGILDEKISLSNYPKRIPTITYIEEEEVFEYYQALQIY